MTQQTAIFKIIKLERLNNSYFGNPAFSITAESANGDRVTGRTASNAAIGYALGYWYEGQSVGMCYHYTRGGRLIFDRLA